MITIADTTAPAMATSYPENSIERQILSILENSAKNYTYSSQGELEFELAMRREIISASYALYKSGMGFAVFRQARCNNDFWKLTPDGGFTLQNGAIPSEAIEDIFANGRSYATECATAMVIVYYKALLAVLGKETFNRQFTNITLMNWSSLDRRLREIGYLQKTSDPLPGDRRYFANPDVDPAVPQWQGENTIDLSGDHYYGHGIGIHDAAFIISSLNGNRRNGSTQSAYLMDTVGRPDFKSLYRLKQL